jgi:hypothetical protein
MALVAVLILLISVACVATVDTVGTYRSDIIGPEAFVPEHGKAL